MSDAKKNLLGIDEDQPTNWFEPLYARGKVDGAGVPWANMATHPCFLRWLASNNLDSAGKTALVVGCGMGDDAIELESLGFQVTAFDVSSTAVDYCNKRFPDAKSEFVQADLLQDNETWTGKFDFVLEIYTVQALPPKYEDTLINNIAKFVAPKGQLLVVAEVSQQERHYKNGPPWLLTPAHVDKFVASGLAVTGSKIEQASLEGGSESYVTLFARVV
ncbi:MAG TPA: SAM-dependent methyltransferase [Oceanospirillaceae bacterium]|nr:SAM-dependent methyltransferase [Oceanospirillaceae bacterium]